MPTSREEDLEWPKARSDRDLTGEMEDWLLGVVGVVGEGVEGVGEDRGMSYKVNLASGGATSAEPEAAN
jgi:hypothetical protein